MSPLISALLTPTATLIVGWLVGYRLVAYWGLWQKRREQTLLLTNEFYKIYGDFFAIWKPWNCYLKYSRQAVPLDSERNPSSTSFISNNKIAAVGSDRGWSLLERAAAAEGSMETMIVKLASERHLSEKEVETLARFRQGFQSLREVISDGKRLDWNYSEHIEYLAFKKLAVATSRLVSTVDKNPVPSEKEAQKSLARITGNEWERRWAAREYSYSEEPTNESKGG